MTGEATQNPSHAAEALALEVVGRRHRLQEAPDSSFVLKNLAGWDSVRAVNALVEIEKKLRCRFRPSEVAALKTWGDLVALIATQIENA